MTLEPDKAMIEAMWYYKNQGFWIQILTARPSDNLRCFYDTFSWLKAHDVPVDGIGFSGEKYRWLADTQFYNDGKVVCMIDDSPKHSLEYAKHGVPVFSPKLPYNVELEGKDLITMYDSPVGLSNKVKELVNK